MTSVLFGDLVGFTPLAESRDAEEIRELLSRYFEDCRTVIGRYGGTVEKFIGDAVMAVWGVPVAHEDDAERAVRAGLELVSTIAAMGADVDTQGLAMRVGLVTGEVAVTVGATSEGMVAGDAVNTAARVQAAAVPGQVWVDETTRALSAAAIAFTHAGDHTLKGKALPVSLWQATSVVAGIRGDQRIDGLEAPLTGRDRELRLVKELFHATAESGRPRLVVVDGEPGVGKSRLGWEFEKYIDGLTSMVRWHRGRCLSYGDGVAFWALAEAVRARLGLTEEDTGDVVTGKLDAGLAEHVPDKEERAWLRPRLAVLVGADDQESFPREDLFAAWTAFLERVGAGAPVVLVIEDAQHADDGLLDFLDHLLATARASVFVLALARPELLARKGDLGRRRTSVVRLDPLDVPAMTALVDGLVSGLPETARGGLVARSEGIPLFAVETVRALIDRGAVVARGGHHVAAPGIDAALNAVGAPASLQALVAARLDALSPIERRVVADASVLGAAFTRDGIGALASGEVADLDGVLAGLLRKEILAVTVDRFSAERGQYRFVQIVVRQIALAMQSRRDLKARHVAAADFLTGLPDEGDDLAVVIAQHLLDAVAASTTAEAGTDALSGRACDLLTRAARRAARLGAPVEALHLHETALAHTDDPARQADQHLAAAQNAESAGRYTEAAEHAATAAATYRSLGRLVDAALAVAWQARALRPSGDIVGAVALAEPELDAIRDLPKSDRAVLMLARQLANAASSRGDWDTQAHYADLQAAKAEALQDPDALAVVHTVLAIRYQSTGMPVIGATLQAGAIDIARRHELWATLASGLINQAARSIDRDLAVALSAAREACDVARRSGDQLNLLFAVINHGLALWTAGSLPDLRTLLEDNAQFANEPGSASTWAALLRWLDGALGHQAAPPVDFEPTDNENELAWRGCLRAEEALTRGDQDAAARECAESMRHQLVVAGISDDFIHLWPRLVRTALAIKDTALAEQLIDPVRTSPPGLIPAGIEAHWHQLRGLVGAAQGEDPKTVETDLREGSARLRAYGAVGLAAQAEEEYARWLLTQDRPSDAQPLLAHAREVYVEIGAHGWLSRLDAAVNAAKQQD